MLEYQNLGSYTYDVGDGEAQLDLDSIIPIGDELSEEFSEQAAKYAYVAMLAARAEVVWHESKSSLEAASAEAYIKARMKLEANKLKVTESMVNSEKILCTEYRDAVEYELDCQEQYLTFRVLVKALEQRSQMLISLGANIRMEAEQTGILIRNTMKELKETRSKGSKKVTARR